MESRVPPPEQRLCERHNKPICPSEWLRGKRTTQCASCINGRTRSPRARKRRALRWDSEDIKCINHPERRCNRCSYVIDGHRFCGSCGNRSSNGSFNPAEIRRRNKKAYKKSIERRKKFRGNLRGIELFNRSIGYNLVGANGAIQI
jgi:hypothetical protein